MLLKTICFGLSYIIGHPEIRRLRQLVPSMREVETTVHPQLETLAHGAFSASVGFLGTNLQSEGHFGWERVGTKDLDDFKSPSSSLPPLAKRVGSSCLPREPGLPKRP